MGRDPPHETENVRNLAVMFCYGGPCAVALAGHWVYIYGHPRDLTLLLRSMCIYSVSRVRSLVGSWLTVPLSGCAAGFLLGVGLYNVSLLGGKRRRRLLHRLLDRAGARSRSLVQGHCWKGAVGSAAGWGEASCCTAVGT